MIALLARCLHYLLGCHRGRLEHFEDGFGEAELLRPTGLISVPDNDPGERSIPSTEEIILSIRLKFNLSEVIVLAFEVVMLLVFEHNFYDIFLF